MTSPPRLTHVRLLVDNYRECHRFYREVLGFTPRFAQPEGVYDEFAAGARWFFAPAAEKIAISLYDRAMMAGIVGTGALPARAPVQDTMLIAFAVEDVDAAYDALTGMGVKFLAPPTDRPEWLARIVHLRDPAGNLIELWAPIHSANCVDGDEQ